MFLQTILRGISAVAGSPKRISTVGPTLAVVNLSTVLTDRQVADGVAAAQIQIDRDFGPLWGIGANLMFVPRSTKVQPNIWIIQVLDTSDQAGALGYHSMTANALPVGKVFAKDDQKYGLSWSVTLTHEIMEMLADPFVNSTVFVQDTATTGTLYALETADPVEDDSFGYLINGVLVSNFITPAYFQAGRAPGSAKFDFKGVLTAPLTVAKSGYQSVFEVGPASTGWTQRAGSEGKGRRLLARGPESRPMRRAAIPEGPLPTIE